MQRITYLCEWKSALVQSSCGGDYDAFWVVGGSPVGNTDVVSLLWLPSSLVCLVVFNVVHVLEQQQLQLCPHGRHAFRHNRVKHGLDCVGIAAVEQALFRVEKVDVDAVVVVLGCNLDHSCQGIARLFPPTLTHGSVWLFIDIHARAVIADKDAVVRLEKLELILLDARLSGCTSTGTQRSCCAAIL